MMTPDTRSGRRTGGDDMSDTEVQMDTFEITAKITLYGMSKSQAEAILRARLSNGFPWGECMEVLDVAAVSERERDTGGDDG